MEPFNSKIAIVIPSLNRSDLWLRQVAYYAEVGYNHAVYVGDSTENGLPEDLPQQIHDLQSLVNLKYLPLPGLNDLQAVNELLLAAPEPYAVFCGDDDFFVPGSLELCAEFLDDHPDYSGAHGVAAYCATTAGTGYGEVAWSTHYRLPSLELPTASQRLTAFLDANFETIFSVRRTNEFQEDINATLPMGDKGFRDLTVCCLPIIRGKVKRLDNFYLMRLTHKRQYLINSVFEWVTGPDWNDSYKIFIDYVANLLAQKDGIPVDDARSILKHSFAKYLARSFSEQKDLFDNDSATSRLRGLAKLVPGIRWGRELLRSTRSSDYRMLSLPALLRRSSPYYKDFLPIYRSISSPIPELTDTLN